MEYTLNKVLGLRDAVIINLGAIIGAGIFVIIGLAIGRSGPAIIISILLSAFIAILTGLSFSEIARHTSKEGGVYEYAKEAFTPAAGFVGGLMWTFSNMIAISAVALSMGQYIDSFLSIKTPAMFFAIPAIVIFALLNIFGIKNSAKTLTALVALNIIILLLFIMFGLTHFAVSHFSNFAPNGFNGILAGSALIFFAFTGFSRVTTIGDEVKDSEKTIPKAIVISILVSALIYIAIAVVAVGLLPYKEIASSAAPLSAAIAVLHNPIIDLIIAFGGITATAGVVLTGILGTSRVLFAMGRDNELPKQVAQIDRYSTPQVAIILSTIIAIIFIYFVSFSTIVEASNAAVLLAYAIINISALVLWNRLRKEEVKTNKLIRRSYFFIIPILSTITIAITISYLGYVALESSFIILIAFSLIYLIKYAVTKYGHVASANEHVPYVSIVRLFGKSRSEFSKLVNSGRYKP